MQFYVDLALQVITELRVKTPIYDAKLVRLSEAPDADPSVYRSEWAYPKNWESNDENVTFTGLLPDPTRSGKYGAAEPFWDDLTNYEWTGAMAPRGHLPWPVPRITAA